MRRSCLLLSIVAILAVGCVERAPEFVADGGDVGEGDAGMTGTDGARPSLDVESFEANRGSLGVEALWYFFGTDGDTVVEDVSGQEGALMEIESSPGWDGDEGLLFGAETVVSSSVAPGNVGEAVANSNEFSIELWVEPDRGGNYHVASARSGGTPFLALAIESNGLIVSINDGQQSRQLGGVFNDDRLTYVVVTMQRGILSFFIDGVLAAAWSVQIDTGAWSGIDEIVLGNADGVPFEGKMTMFAVWSRALGESEVFQHFLAGELDEPNRRVEQLMPGMGLLVAGPLMAAWREHQETVDVGLSEEEEPNRAGGIIELSSEKRMLVRFDDLMQLPEGRKATADVATIVVDQGSTDAIVFEVAALWRWWRLSEVSWVDWVLDEPWSEPGADGTDDRSEPFAEFVPTDRRRLSTQLPDGLVEYWVTTPDEHGGLLYFKSDEMQASERRFFSEDDNWSTRRPYVARLFEGGQIPSGVIDPPVGLRRDNVSNSRDVVLRWAPVPGAEFYDVFANGRLIGRTGDVEIFDQNGGNSGERRYRVLARDTFGRISPFSEEFVVNEGM